MGSDEQSDDDVLKEIRRVERALFSWLIASPRTWSIAELRAEFGPDTDERVLISAVARLSDAGLVRWRGDWVTPTLAAIRANELTN